MKFHMFVICAFGESPYLEACVRSLRGQTVKSDILCATSTPNDYIRSVMDRYGIPVAVREGKSDIQDDWNFALAQADAAYVTLAHQDDMYSRHYVEELRNACMKWPDMTVFMTDAVTVRNGRMQQFGMKEAVKKLLRLPLRLHRFADREWVKMGALKLGNPVMCPSCAYRKGYLPDPIFHSEFRYVLDWDCMSDIAKWPGRVICVEKPLLFYRVHGGAETSARIADHSREREERQMYERFWPGWAVEILMFFYRKAYDEYL